MVVVETEEWSVRLNNSWFQWEALCRLLSGNAGNLADVYAKFLFGLWEEDTAAALALLDQPSILQRLRPSLAQGAAGASFNCHTQFVWRRLCCGTGTASGAATAHHRKKI